jgi:protein TonB
VGALLITLLVFLVLPITQMISSQARKESVLRSVDLAAPPPPPPVIEEPPPPPPEEKPEEPPPQLQEPPRQLAFDQLDLDLDVGTGGVFAEGFGTFGQDGEELARAIFSVADLDRAPEPVVQVNPVYPRELRNAGAEGSVVVVFVVNEDGQVEDPRVESSSRPEFERPALEAVRKWRFRPGTREGEPVRTHLRQPLRFRVAS